MSKAYESDKNFPVSSGSANARQLVSFKSKAQYGKKLSDVAFHHFCHKLKCL